MKWAKQFIQVHSIHRQLHLIDLLLNNDTEWSKTPESLVNVFFVCLNLKIVYKPKYVQYLQYILWRALYGQRLYWGLVHTVYIVHITQKKKFHLQNVVVFCA